MGQVEGISGQIGTVLRIVGWLLGSFVGCFLVS
jgi:hypothetical protein